MMGLTARDVMTRDVLAAQADWPVDRLAEFLIENDISGAPVIAEDGTLIGVVSLTDIVRHDSLHQKEPHAHVYRTHDYYLPVLEDRYAQEEVAMFQIRGDSDVTVQDIMTPMIFEVDEATPVPQVAEKMVRGRIHRVFVTRQNTVVGIITALGLLDVLRP